jgi:phosphatidate cytidylyltransferase
MRWLPLAIPLDVGQQPWSWLVFGPFVGVAGMAGDLAESLLKRDAGVKDSSTWLPGFGGLLDLLDSILFAAPVAYLCWLLGST